VRNERPTRQRWVHASKTRWESCPRRESLEVARICTAVDLDDHKLSAAPQYPSAFG
jgi:hypothetical protein